MTMTDEQRKEFLSCFIDNVDSLLKSGQLTTELKTRSCGVTGLTAIEGELMWQKMLQFNHILIKKYGDSYWSKAGEIMKVTEDYRDSLIIKIKRDRKK